jgi:hypothetical protein
MPADGEPIVGPVSEVPRLYLAVMHSAVTLAPAAGRLVAQELVDGTVESALAGCRLDRFYVPRLSLVYALLGGIRLRQLQTSAPDKQPDHQPRPADIDDDRLGARTVRPSGGRRDVRAGHQLSRRGPSGGLKASARPPCRPAGRRGPPLLPRRRPLPLPPTTAPSSASAASAIAPPAHPRRTPQALRRSRLP